MIDIKKGNIFTSKCQTKVNTINCVGVMGAGIAYEFRLRFPDLYEKYLKLCEQKLIQIGKLWLYKVDEKNLVLNFPTKYDWKYPSKIEYLEKGLQKFVETYKERKITSIAFPLLGASNGGIPENISAELMKTYLSECDIPIEIWFFDRYAKDDLYEKFKYLFNNYPERELSSQSKLRIDFVRKVKNALERKDINSISGLLRVKGIGEITLEKSFKFIMQNKSGSSEDSLFSSN